jgi:hypothetical protein
MELLNSSFTPRSAPSWSSVLIDSLDDDDVELSPEELVDLDRALVDADRAAERGH